MIIAGKDKTKKCFHLHAFNLSIFSPGGLKGAWCSRVPGRACSPPKPTTPSSPSPSPVWFSTPWGRPTSASWWTFTVSPLALLSRQTCLIHRPYPTHPPLPRSASQRDDPRLCVCFCASSRPHPVGGAAAENGRCRLRCHPELQMGWEPSPHPHMVQKGFKHGKRLDLQAFLYFFFFTHTTFTFRLVFFYPSVVIAQGHERACTQKCLFFFSSSAL